MHHPNVTLCYNVSYRALTTQRLAALKEDVESPRRNVIEMNDLANLGTLFTRAHSTRRCVDVSCPPARTPAKCTNSFHLALEKERQGKEIAPAGE